MSDVEYRNEVEYRMLVHGKYVASRPELDGSFYTSGGHYFHDVWVDAIPADTSADGTDSIPDKEEDNENA